MREFFTAAPNDPAEHANVELAMTAGLTFAVYEAPPKRDTAGGGGGRPLNPFKYPMEARRRHMAAYNALALIMALFLLGMIYQDFANHRVWWILNANVTDTWFGSVKDKLSIWS